MMPRGLYGRAALILLVPIITLQIVVSGQILQRYFREVAAQMSTALALDLQLVADAVAAGEGQARGIAAALKIDIAMAPPGLLRDQSAAGPRDCVAIGAGSSRDFDSPRRLRSYSLQQQRSSDVVGGAGR